MEKTVRIVSLKEPQSDYAYWMKKTAEERLAAIEFLRQQYINYRKDAQPGFQRVCRIINRTQS